MRLSRNMPYRILYLNRSSEISGAEISLILLLERLDRGRFWPLIAVPSEGPLCKKLKEKEVDFRIEPLAFLKTRNPLPFIRTIGRLVKIIREEKISFVHANDYIGNQYGVIASRLAGVPIISHVRLILGPRAIRNSFLRYADHLIANSNTVAHALESAGISKDRISVVWNGVDSKAFSPNSDHGGRKFRDCLGVPDKGFLIGYIGRIHYTKGIHTLIQAMTEVVKNGPGAMLIIVGDIVIDQSSEYLTRLKMLTQKLGLTDLVHFMPFQDNIRAVYDAVDLVVLPSLAEPFGRVLIEAMAMEKPVIGTRAGGAVEIVEDGITGLLVPPEDPYALAQAMFQLMKNREIAIRMAKMGRKRAETLFSIEENVERIQKIYKKKLNEGQ